MHFKQDLWLRGKLVVVEGVPAGVCGRCGARVVRAEVGKRLSALFEDGKRRRRPRSMSVPVYRFSNVTA